MYKLLAKLVTVVLRYGVNFETFLVILIAETNTSGKSYTCIIFSNT